ncbi:hypothetical protein GOB94_06765 [Granulicella sp. 5B5]|uniref:hypothetical protein n=1 Tax=Granulicella sp. 5B5 TaxID=1617967 RepID=UPI0015F4D70D|nr:hypothetical protein [Granulicella sp. 5B5]QMV18417.1 hypothetical protein GOB94_06765 [Granulicella sp. 5B5]
MAYLTVIPALVLLGVTPYRRNPFVRFHAMQCVVLTALAIAGRVMLHYSHFKPMLVGGLYLYDGDDVSVGASAGDGSAGDDAVDSGGEPRCAESGGVIRERA